MLLLPSCGFSTAHDAHNTSTSINVSISPSNISLLSGSSQQFTATISNSNSNAVTWAVSEGAISSRGVFTAPFVSQNTTVKVTATSVADPTKSASTSVTVSAVQVLISPLSAPLPSGGQQQFSATVSGTNNKAVTWSASAGTISTGGLFTAPRVSVSTTVAVTAASVADSSKTASAAITVTPASSPLSIQTSVLPDATRGTTYSMVLSATGGQLPYQWSITSGTLPQGIQFDSLTGAISGIASTSGSFTFAATVSDSGSQTATRQLRLTVKTTTNGALIPASFFGMQSLPPGSNGGTTYPSALSFGTYRLFNPERGMGWNTQNPASGSYDWSKLDIALANLYSHGVTDGVVYTIAAVPSWASTNAADTNCDFLAPGGCDLPSDIANDGSGLDNTYVTFVRALASHVNDPTFLLTHAHIRYYEPWNEWYRNPLLGAVYATCGSGTGRCSIHATYAQMVRMTEDLHCAVTGTGTVDGSACGYSAIDANAMILMPSSEGTAYGAGVFENFLHCNDSPYAGSLCTTGDRGRNAVAVLNFHLYVSSGPAENVVTQVAMMKSLLGSSDLAAPLWSGEGGWLADTSRADPDLQAAFVGRYYLLGWSAGLSTMVWYEYDNPKMGTLCAPQTNCTLTPAGFAYQQVYKWMVDNTLSSCAAAGTVYTCPMAKSNGAHMLAIWDSSQSCSNGVCSTVELPVDPIYLQYHDLLGALTPITSNTVPVGAKPILLDSQ